MKYYNYCILTMDIDNYQYKHYRIQAVSVIIAIDTAIKLGADKEQPMRIYVEVDNNTCIL